MTDQPARPRSAITCPCAGACHDREHPCSMDCAGHHAEWRANALDQAHEPWRPPAPAVEMANTWVNGRWQLQLPAHRAARPEWPWWEAARLSCMAHHVSHHDVVYDIGAEEGDMAALWASWGADVALFEPNPLAWPNIRAVWDANHLPPPLACWAGFAAAAAPRGMDGGLGWPDAAWGPVVADHGFLNLSEHPDAPRTTIDEMARAIAPPTVITIDVEGSELHVLTGACETLKALRPLVWVSVHPEAMATLYGQQTGHLHDYMATLGYRATFLALDHEEHWFFWPAERNLVPS